MWYTVTCLVISPMLSVAEPVQLCAEPCCLAVMCSQSVSQWEERPEEERGTGRLGGRSRSALVPRVSLILKESGWEIPELSSLWNGFYLFCPLVMCTPCCIAQVSNNSRPWLTVVWVRVCLLLFSGLKRCNNETCSTLTLPVLFTVFCPRLSPFTVG